MASFGWDQGAVYSTAVQAAELKPNSNQALETSLFDFIQLFHDDNHYVYRDQLHQNLMVRKYVLEVNLNDLVSYNEDLADSLKKSPAEILPLFESAVRRSAQKILNVPGAEMDNRVPACQVVLKSSENVTTLRELDASHINRLIRVTGIVIGASTLTAKATTVHLMCRACRHVKIMPVTSGFGGIQMPRMCEAQPIPGTQKECPMDPFIVVHDKCKFVDQQTIKLQEAPDVVPVGELPRHMVMSADRYLTNRVMPGARVTVMGIHSVVQQKQARSERNSGAVAIRSAYLRVVGLKVHQEESNRALHSSSAGSGTLGLFSEQEEEEFMTMARRPDFYQEFTAGIAPSIFGHEDVKKAVACLLMGGSKKRLPDGMRLRGDINVLLLGDPGVAKSQLLKFVEKAAPIAVYTSGKGSSAAGLTASVIRDPNSREFYLEGGAMVLADGGVVCIDEFDKMREEDRVAIHEAMEQQTISIAKAGITTVLNSRASVLAAANPIFGRYDDLKTPGENIDFQTTILSRFDMIFILKDAHNEEQDQRIARHVMDVHKAKRPDDDGAHVLDLDLQKMRRFVTFARSKCAPRLSEEAAEKLSSHFVDIRSQVRQMESETSVRASVPITVRQLEAVIRISEALAKMTLSLVVHDHHVDEAIRLFRFSTMNAVQSGQIDGLNLNEMKADIRRIEEDINRRLPLGSQISVRTLVNEFVRNNHAENAVQRAVRIMVDRGSLEYRYQRATVVRIGL
ncbi:minichromosome maintenance protein 5 [Sorochytrium milnesiophthora]